MATLARIPVVWDGLSGLPGLSVFYSLGTDSVAAVAALKTFFTALAPQFPTGLSWTFPSGGDEFQDTTGTLSGTWSGAAGAVINASGGAGVWAGGTGARVKWGTGTIVNGRRLKGSTFLVPLLAAVYDSNGTLQNATVANWQTAANTLVGVNVTRVWHRPSPGGSDGTSAAVITAQVPDRVSNLRSRRS